MLYSLKDGAWTEWAYEEANLGYPSWSADSKYLYYQNLGENASVKRIRVGQSSPEVVFKLAGLPRYQAVGFWTAVTPQGESMFVRDLSTDEIYAMDIDLP